MAQDNTVNVMPTPFRRLPNTHLDDFVDGERLCCTFPVRHQQLQTPVTIKVCGYSTWRAITLMMQLNTSGNSLHNILMPGNMDIMLQQSQN